MKITEYRNGVAIGSVIRDIQVIVLVCTTPPPTTTGFNGQPSDITQSNDTTDLVWSHCPDGSGGINFTIESPAGGGTSNNKVMSWNGLSALNGTAPVNLATYTVAGNNTSNPIGTFNWVPTFLDAQSSPFVFTINVTDDACPVNNSFFFTYKI